MVKGTVYFDFFPKYFAHAWPIDTYEQHNASIDKLFCKNDCSKPSRYFLYDYRWLILRMMDILNTIAPCYNDMKKYTFELQSADSTCYTIAFKPSIGFNENVKGLNWTGSLVIDADRKNLQRINIIGMFKQEEYLNLLADRYTIPKHENYVYAGDFQFDRNCMITSANCSVTYRPAVKASSAKNKTDETTDGITIKSWWNLEDVRAISIKKINIDQLAEKQHPTLIWDDSSDSLEIFAFKNPNLYHMYVKQINAAHYDKDLFARLPLQDPDFAEHEVWLSRENNIENQYASETFMSIALKPFIGLNNGQLDTIPTKNLFLNNCLDEILLRKSTGYRHGCLEKISMHSDQLRENLSNQELMP